MWNRQKVPNFFLPINSLFLFKIINRIIYLFLFKKINNSIYEEINALFIGMLCLITLEVLILDVVKALIPRHFRGSSSP